MISSDNFCSDNPSSFKTCAICYTKSSIEDTAGHGKCSDRQMTLNKATEKFAEYRQKPKAGVGFLCDLRLKITNVFK